MSKYLPLKSPNTSWFDYPTFGDRQMANSFSGHNTVGIVLPSQSELERYQSRRSSRAPTLTATETETEGNPPDKPTTAQSFNGYHLATELADNPSQFLTNKRDIGWDPSVNKALTGYHRLCQDGATIEELDREMKLLQMGKCANKNVKFVSLSPSQATDYVEKKIVVDMTDCDSLYSPAMRSMRVSQNSAIGLCAHPDLGLRLLCSQNTKTLLNRDNFWNDRVTAESCLGNYEYSGSTDAQRHINHALDVSERYKGHCSFVQITPEEHDELLLNQSFRSPIEALTENEVAHRPAPRGMGI